VVTYTSSGIFNFAHGAIGMIGAYSYWQLTVGWGWPSPPAMALILLVGAPLLGAGIERVLIRPLRGAAVDLTLMVTLGLLLFLVGVANLLWKPTQRGSCDSSSRALRQWRLAGCQSASTSS